MRTNMYRRIYSQWIGLFAFLNILHYLCSVAIQNSSLLAPPQKGPIGDIFESICLGSNLISGTTVLVWNAH